MAVQSLSRGYVNSLLSRNLDRRLTLMSLHLLWRQRRHFASLDWEGRRCKAPSPLRSAGALQIGYNPCVSTLHYSDEHNLAYPIEYIAGIDLYNSGEFHAAHDAWEERWMGPVAPDEKLFLQAMIQSAVAFHHLQIGRPGAARRMYLMAEEKLARLNQPIFMSLDLAVC